MPVMKQQHTANLVCALLFIFGAVSACREEAKPRLFNRLIFLSRQSGDYDVRLRTTNDRQPVELGRVVPWDSQPFWSPDGTRIAFYSDRNLECRCHRVGRQPEAVLLRPDGDIGAAAAQYGEVESIDPDLLEDRNASRRRPPGASTGSG